MKLPDGKTTDCGKAFLCSRPDDGDCAHILCGHYDRYTRDDDGNIIECISVDDLVDGEGLARVNEFEAQFYNRETNEFIWPRGGEWPEGDKYDRDLS